MENFIQRIFSKEPSSADKAKDRLRLVLAVGFCLHRLCRRAEFVLCLIGYQQFLQKPVAHDPKLAGCGVGASLDLLSDVLNQVPSDVAHGLRLLLPHRHRQEGA